MDIVMTAIVTPHGSDLVHGIDQACVYVCVFQLPKHAEKQAQKRMQRFRKRGVTANICWGGPETILPIWKRLLSGMDHLMDGGDLSRTSS